MYQESEVENELGACCSLCQHSNKLQPCPWTDLAILTWASSTGLDKDGFVTRWLALHPSWVYQAARPHSWSLPIYCFISVVISGCLQHASSSSPKQNTHKNMLAHQCFIWGCCFLLLGGDYTFWLLVSTSCIHIYILSHACLPLRFGWFFISPRHPFACRLPSERCPIFWCLSALLLPVQEANIYMLKSLPLCVGASVCICPPVLIGAHTVVDSFMNY